MKTVSGGEAANVITHATGVLAGLAGGSVLIVRAANLGDAWSIVGTAIFVAAVIFLYSASTLYHAVQAERIKRRFKILDHCAIYVLIAGTYSPFMLGALRGGWGWSLFGVIWAAALAGVFFKLFFTGRFRRLSTGLYIGMGWLVLLAAVPLVQALEPNTLAWLLAGGVVYTGGTLFYHSERDQFTHAIWHVFVLGGTACHGVAVALQL
jgi:hemolysin III